LCESADAPCPALAVGSDTHLGAHIGILPINPEGRQV
jgi:hypothetical protein